MASESIVDHAGARLGSEADLVALRDVRTGPGPVGSGRICAAMAAAGIAMSEATAGRLLRSLDLRGLTEPLGSKGRVLTERGRQQLLALEEAHQRNAYHHSLRQATHVETVEDILDLLSARLAVESETARLAALRANPEETAAIERAVQRHMSAIRAGDDDADQGRAIHLLIARASRSRVLSAVVELILQDQRLILAQSHIQRATGAVAPEEHVAIVQSIKAHKPERAAEAMRAHIGRLIRAVQKYAANARGVGTSEVTAEPGLGLALAPR